MNPPAMLVGEKPLRSNRLDAYAERFVRSIKCECLGKLVLLGENHLSTDVREYVAHYHTERNHQGPREPAHRAASQ